MPRPIRRRVSTRPFGPPAALVLGVLLGACKSTAPTQTAPNGDEWLRPSPLLAQQIESEARRLPWTRGVELMEQIRWFALVGEPAYPRLLELAADEREHVAAAAFAALGATGDKRLVASLHTVPEREGERYADVNLERSRALVRLGDWSAMTALIRGLADERVYTRSLCAEALFEATNERMGYDPKAAAGEREKAVTRWETWWLARGGEGLLGKS